MISATALELFSRESRVHERELRERGHVPVRQLFTSGSSARNLPWKTYWLATHPTLGESFVKVFYGNAAETNRLLAEKEARLPRYFETALGSGLDLAFPTVLDEWPIGAEAHAVATSVARFESHTLYSLAAAPAPRQRLLRFLAAWSEIGPPDWWTDAHVHHDFALDRQLTRRPAEIAPFGFDLDQNLGILPDGRLLLYDFEFVQWTTRGLQQALLAYKSTGSVRRLLGLFLGSGMASSFVDQIRPWCDRNLVEQAEAVFRESCRRDRRLGLRQRFLLRAARTAILWRARS